jgi:hypothetical protein
MLIEELGKVTGTLGNCLIIQNSEFLHEVWEPIGQGVSPNARCHLFHMGQVYQYVCTMQPEEEEALLVMG